ncbi:hypothetical protein C8R34_1155 [Nitrosomonas sp. Nm84]|uniref:hypothetical protein n=1 Tax=Nitrosomonas sp. Nm84 TaxID=200124 RepID=UPI000D754150|nr:hypothetical protein [Nitrosomonas sp. Nm84]PXW86107.1 hypothetical protein C8R34_1155 [Nitrosomonas sp. Nm84]
MRLSIMIFFSPNLSNYFSWVMRRIATGMFASVVLMNTASLVFAEPEIMSFEAKLDGNNVIQVPPNSTVTLSTVAIGDGLSYTWTVNAGTILSSSNAEAQWQLPVSRGLHFAYVRVTDINGTYVDRGVTMSTDGSAIFGDQPISASRPSDKIPTNEPKSQHFLSYINVNPDFRNINTKEESCLYYYMIGVVTGCGSDGEMIEPKTNFTQWKKDWGLNHPFVGGARAIYANKADLNLQRNMHGVFYAPNDTLAYYVCNYPRVDDLDEGANLDNAIHNLNLAACVAMEKGSDNITKFYVFGPSGDLLQSVNLDGRGEKYIPGACVVCHGGKKYTKDNFTEYDLESNFLPFDLENFVFSSQVGLTKKAQEKSLRQLNEWIRDKIPTTEPAHPIAELINGWYPDPDSEFNSSFVPAGWASNEQLYNDVVKPYCRTCHIALTPNFMTFLNFSVYSHNLKALVCGNASADPDNLTPKIYKMPNARVTFDRLWNSKGITTLRTFLGATEQDCSLPQ